jgi:hypothetical protein
MKEWNYRLTVEVDSLEQLRQELQYLEMKLRKGRFNPDDRLHDSLCRSSHWELKNLTYEQSEDLPSHE